MVETVSYRDQRAEREFLDASAHERERERAERLQAEAARRFRVLSATLGVLAIVVAVLAIVAVRQWQTAEHARQSAEEARRVAERQRREVSALRLALLSKVNESQPASTLLAVEALSVGSQDGPPFVAAAQLRLLEQLAQSHQQVKIVGAGQSLAGVDMSPDSRWMATAMDHTVRLWELNRLTDTAREFDVGARVKEVRFDPLGRWVAASTLLGGIRLWELKRPNAAPRVFPAGSTGATGLAFSGDGSVLAVSSEKGTVWLWQLAQIDSEPRMLTVGEGVNQIALSRDGRRLAVGNADRDSVSMWDLATGSPLWSAPLYEDAGIWQIRFSPDGRMLAVGIAVAVRLFDAENGRFLAQPREAAKFFAFNPDGEWLVAASRDDALRLVDLRAPAQIPSIIRNASRDVRGVAVSADGRWLSAATNDGALVWAIDPPRLMAIACTVAGRNFTSDEWSPFFLTEPCRPICPGLPDKCVTSVPITKRRR